MAKDYFEIVDGYVFRSPETAKQAKKELEGIRFVKKQMDVKEPEAVLQVYNQILKEKLFHTIVGYSFLRELQEYLKCCPQISGEYIRPLDLNERHLKTDSGAITEREKKVKHHLATAFIVNIILVLLVITMMVLMYFSDNATIINYENKIIDRYEHWEQELKEREQAVKEKEKELGIQP